MIETCTSIKQGKHLLELGIDPDTADMYYFQNIDPDYFPPDREWYSAPCAKDSRFDIKYDVPAWTLNTLLKLIPGYNLKSNDNGFFVTSNRFNYITAVCITEIDAAYEMVCWLLERNYIKKRK